MVALFILAGPFLREELLLLERSHVDIGRGGDGTRAASLTHLGALAKHVHRNPALLLTSSRIAGWSPFGIDHGMFALGQPAFPARIVALRLLKCLRCCTCAAGVYLAINWGVRGHNFARFPFLLPLFFSSQFWLA